MITMEQDIVLCQSREGGEVNEERAVIVWDANADKALPDIESINWIKALDDGLSGSIVSRLFEAKFGKDDSRAAALKRLYRIRDTECFRIRIELRRAALPSKN